MDRAFVDGLGIDPHHFVLVGAIVAIADALGLEVTADGLENQDQLAGLIQQPPRGQVIPLAGRVIRGREQHHGNYRRTIQG